VGPLRKFLQYLLIEGVNVIGTSACHDPAFDHHGSVDPVGSRVGGIYRDRWMGGRAPPADNVRTNQQRGRVTDCRHRLARIEEHAQTPLPLAPRELGGIHHTAREKKTVVGLDPRLIERATGRDAL
jgi:hypothetical protein